MLFRRLVPQLRLRSLLLLVGLCAILFWAANTFLSPTGRLSAGLQPGVPAYLRREAAIGLGSGIPSWEVDRAISILIPTLKDPSPRVRESAAAGLAGHGYRAKQSIPYLIEMLGDPDRGARQSAVGALGFIAEPGESASIEVVPHLILALDDQDLNVRLMAAHNLIIHGEFQKLAPTFVTAMAQPDGTSYRYQAKKLIGLMGRNNRVLIPGFTALTHDKDPRRREAALQLLLDQGGPFAVESALPGALKDNDSSIQKWAAEKLGKVGLLDDPSKDAPLVSP